jgi:hypothetical protein
VTASLEARAKGPDAARVAREEAERPMASLLLAELEKRGEDATHFVDRANRGDGRAAMDEGELLTRWTVRLAVVLYAAALALRIAARARRAARREPAGGCIGLRAARLVWTGGFAAYLVHVACAFHFYHGWSHRAAYEATARQSAEVVGLAWGGGLYANYAFTLVWGADVAWWWAAPAHYRQRPRIVEWAVQAFLAFIVVNATVVFGFGTIRWIGLAAGVALAGLVGAALTRGRFR